LNEQLVLDHGLAITILDDPFAILQDEVAQNSTFGVRTYQNLAKLDRLN
jgi:hypothetical protein